MLPGIHNVRVGKVYAVGIRTGDTKLPRPQSKIVDSNLLHSAAKKDYHGHSVNYRRLPWGYIPTYAPWSVDRHDSDTVIRGLAKRLGRDLPPTDSVLIGRFACFVTEWLRKNVRPVVPLSFDDWIASAPWPGGRKLEIIDAYQRFFGISPTARQCEHIDSFIKSEFYPEEKESRWINSRTDLFKAFAGPYFKAIEEELYKNPWFIKHVPVPDRPQAIKNLAAAGLRYFENDYKAFESHMTPEIMEACELQLYRHCLKGYPWAAQFICDCVSGTNRLHNKLGISFTLEGRRMSGDMCTSLGNGFTNLMLVLFIVSEKGGKVSGFVEGDDGLFATTVELNAQDFLRMGFTVEICEKEYPWDAHFCGMTCSEDCTLLKNPRKVLQGFGWTQSMIHAGVKKMEMLLRSKALSLCYEAPQCPIVGVLAREALRLTEGVKATEDENWNKRPQDYEGPTGPFSPSDSARTQFEKVFGVPVGVQKEIETAILDHDMFKVAALLPAHDDIAWYDSAYVEVR